MKSVSARQPVEQQSPVSSSARVHSRAPCAAHSLAAAARSMSSTPPLTGSRVIGTTSFPPCTPVPQIESCVVAGLPSLRAMSAPHLPSVMAQQRSRVSGVTWLASMHRDGGPGGQPLIW
jgi:hypothetical protein